MPGRVDESAETVAALFLEFVHVATAEQRIALGVIDDPATTAATRTLAQGLLRVLHVPHPEDVPALRALTTDSSQSRLARSLARVILQPFEQAKAVLRRYGEYVLLAPDDLNVWIVLRQAPPLPFLPTSVHGRVVVVLAVFYAGGLDQADSAIMPLRHFGSARWEHIDSQSYVTWQQAFDPLLTPGARNYWKSHNFTQLSDGAIDCMIQFAGCLPSSQTEIFVGLIAGAANHVPAAATAYFHRDARFVMNVHGRWNMDSADERCIDWARAFFKASGRMHPRART
jgi:hypothetical protein